jgi:hypothetical protein
MVLASRGLQPLQGGTRALLPAAIFAAAIAVAASLGWLAVPVAFRHCVRCAVADPLYLNQ